MNPEQFFEQIAQGQYKTFRQYLYTGNNGRPVTSLNLSFKLREIPNQSVFLDHLFEALKPITTLTTLNLSGNKFYDAGADTIAQALKTNKTLTSLGLVSNNIDNKGAAAIAKALNTNTTITALDLGNNIINDEGAIAIAQSLKGKTNLTKLNLNCNKVHLKGATTIAQALNTNTKLTALDLGDNDINDEGAVAIAQSLKTNKTLTTLGLDGSDIGPKGANAIAEALKTNTTLITLELCGNNIGPAGAVDIAQALNTNTTLTSLDLYGNNIGDVGATAIAQALNTNKALTTLDLEFNHINDEGAAALLRQIPLESTLTTLHFYVQDTSPQNNINEIIDALQTEKEVLDEVYRLWPQPITEAFAQHFTLITNETAQNLLIDPNNDISRGLAYVQRRKLTKDNENIIEQNKRREQAQSRESAQETPLNAAPTSNDSQNTSQTFALGKRNKEQDNSVKRPRTRYQNISKREAEEINKEAKVFCGEIKDENEGKRRKLRARK